MRGFPTFRQNLPKRCETFVRFTTFRCVFSQMWLIAQNKLNISQVLLILTKRCETKEKFHNVSELCIKKSFFEILNPRVATIIWNPYQSAISTTIYLKYFLVYILRSVTLRRVSVTLRRVSVTFRRVSRSY